ncbi:MAG: GNAT family N-acetyltransferase [Brevundimonas sp.]|nr:MAG: GNAT family N-acetyltransferase [Brevundimonas sp.]
MSGPEIQLITPESPEDWQDTRLILRDYAASLDVDLGFQGFEEELAGLPGAYGQPGGLMLLALVDGAVAGCGAFRPLPDADYPNACEMKRLFVRPAFRRFGLGRMLAQQLMDRATEAGYSSMLLDTLDDMEAARGLYESLGFVNVPPFYFNPIPGAHYLKAELGAFRPSYFG